MLATPAAPGPSLNCHTLEMGHQVGNELPSAALMCQLAHLLGLETIFQKQALSTR
jgi:hypothetical protein